jgi:hypothetical protein
VQASSSFQRHPYLKLSFQERLTDNDLRCHIRQFRTLPYLYCFRIGSKFRRSRSTPIAMRSIDENGVERLVSSEARNNVLTADPLTDGVLAEDVRVQKFVAKLAPRIKSLAEGNELRKLLVFRMEH